MPLACPACGETHKWGPKDAWISKSNGSGKVTPEIERARNEAQHEIERLKSDNRDLARMLAAARQQLEEKLKVLPAIIAALASGQR
jgi:hypothetical protein